MLLEHFKNITHYHKLFNDSSSELNSMGFDFFEGKYELVSFVENIVDNIMLSEYGKAGHDWYCWFCYDTVYGEIPLDAFIGGEKIDLTTIENLHSFLEEHYLVKKEGEN